MDDAFDFPPGLKPHFLWSASIFSFAASVSTAVRLALDDKHALRLNADTIRPVFFREGIAALVTGPLLLVIFLAVTGNPRPIFFSSIAAGLTLWFMASMVGNDAIFGTTTTMVTLFRDVTIVILRRAIRLGLALAAGYLWRVLLLDRFGINAIETLFGLCAYAVFLHGVEKLPLPIEAWLFSLQTTAATTLKNGLSTQLRLLADYSATLVDEAMKGPFDPLGDLLARIAASSAAQD